MNSETDSDSDFVPESTSSESDEEMEEMEEELEDLMYTTSPCESYFNEHFDILCRNIYEYTSFEEITEDIIQMATDANYLPTSEDLVTAVTHICTTLEYPVDDQAAHNIWISIKNNIEGTRRQILNERLVQYLD
jgi:hypothetical protein